MSFVSLGEVADVFNGKTPAKSEQREVGHPVLKIRDVDDAGRFRGRFGSFVDEGFVAQFSKKQVLPGDTLILNAAHNADYVGSKSFLAAEDVSGALATGEWLIVRPNHRRLDPGFAYYWLTSAAARAAIRDQVKGIHLYPKDVARLSIPLPPLDEQRRIAAILDKADALRRKRKRALELLDGLTQSIFLEMFGDPVENPKNLPVAKLGDVGSLDRGVSKHRPRNDPALLGGSHPFIQTGDVSNSGGYIRAFGNTYSEKGLAQSKIWPKGTLCITIAANIAQTGILTFDACFPDSVVGYAHPDPNMVQYVRVWLTFLQSTLERSAPASAQKNINLQILRDLNICTPDAGDLARFGSVLEAQLNQERRLRSANFSWESAFASLQHRAFSGQL